MQAHATSAVAASKFRAWLFAASTIALFASTAPAPAAAAVNGKYLIACFLVHNGPFDQGKGAVFFSEVGSVTIVNGMQQGGPELAFRDKVKASYNITGAAACFTDPSDPAKLQASLVDVANSYKRHKHVQTGFKPLE